MEKQVLCKYEKAAGLRFSMIFSQTVDFPEAEPPATPIRRGGPLFSARRNACSVQDLDLDWIRTQLGH
jgi:hypothetical protein